MADRLQSARAERFQREFVTSEGIDLRLLLASAGERASAFLVDVVMMLVVLIVLSIVAAVMVIGTRGSGTEVIASIWLLGFFLLRNAYFIAFELGMRAATPGKRIMGLRVVARDGGRLSGEAVIARNAVRELELFLPLSFVMSGGGGGGVDTWTAIAGFGWAGVFLFFPLFNRDRLRVGDLIAGTWVVHTPKRKLGHKVVSERVAAAPQYAFTDAQLNAYGEFELQKLEEVLRREDDLATIVVARTIRSRIGWNGDEGNDLEFLQAYYAALCQRLERNMLFGKRRADKYQNG